MTFKAVMPTSEGGDIAVEVDFSVNRFSRAVEIEQVTSDGVPLALCNGEHESLVAMAQEALQFCRHGEQEDDRFEKLRHRAMFERN